MPMQFSTAGPRLDLRVYWVYWDINHPFRLFDMQEEMAVAIFSGIVYDSHQCRAQSDTSKNINHTMLRNYIFQIQVLLALLQTTR